MAPMHALAATAAALLIGALWALPASAEEPVLHVGEEAKAAARQEAAARSEIERFDFETRKDESLRRAALTPTRLGIEGSPHDVVRQREALDLRFYLDRRRVERDLEQITRGAPGLQAEVERSLERLDFERRQRQVQHQTEFRAKQLQSFRDRRSPHVTRGVTRGLGRSCR